MPHLPPQGRYALPDSAFGLLQTRAHLMPDVAHGHFAKGPTAEEFNTAKLTASENARIDRTPDHILGNEA